MGMVLGHPPDNRPHHDSSLHQRVPSQTRKVLEPDRRSRLPYDPDSTLAAQPLEDAASCLIATIRALAAPHIDGSLLFWPLSC